jgi:pre-mRNA-splicing factor SYF1
MLLGLFHYLLLTINSTDVNFIASQAVARSTQLADGEALDDKIDAMAALEREARAPVGFVAASTGPEGASRDGQQAMAIQNPDAIEVDLDDL